MRFNILCDADWESRVDQVLNELSDFGYRQYFEEQDYGSGMLGITVVLMCQEPGLNLKQRMRFAKKEKKLYLDVMLNLTEMKASNPEQRRNIVATHLVSTVHEVVGKRKIEEFNSVAFFSDFDKLMQKTGWLQAAKGATGTTGKVGEDTLKLLGSESQVSFKTTTGSRYVDQLVNGVANDSKVGYTTLTTDVSRQIAKDVELVNTG